MLLSIIIPYYNRNAFIGRMLDSLLDQGFAPMEYEIIVVDDGSEEKPVVLQEYASRYKQVKYFRTEHAGLSPARNYGLAMAKGEWLYFCDSDDYVQKQTIREIIAVAEKKQLEMVFAKVTIVNESEDLPYPKRNYDMVTNLDQGFDYLGNSQIPFAWGVYSYLIRRSIVEDNGLVFRDIFFLEDRVFLLELLPYVVRAASIDVDLYYYVQHEDSIMHSIKNKDRTKSAAAIMKYVEVLSTTIDNPSSPRKLVDYLQNHERIKWTYNLLTHVFKYYSVNKTIDYINRLKGIGAYPLGETSDRISAPRVKLVNSTQLWIFLCRMYHFLPTKVRMKI